MLGGSDLQLHVESESPDIRHNSLDFSVCIFQLDLQPTTDSGILYQLCAMANGQTLMSVLPSIPTFPHKSSTTQMCSWTSIKWQICMKTVSAEAHNTIPCLAQKSEMVR